MQYDDKKSLMMEAERLSEHDAIFMRREHLKRQYLRYYKMEKIIKNKKKSEQVAKIKRQILRMMGRD